MWTIIWLVVAAIMIVVEIITMGLTSIWFAGGAIVSAIISYLGGGEWIQIIAFIAVSIVLLIGTRPFVKKHLIKKVEKTNVESYIGKKVVVLKEIDNNKEQGQIMMNDVEWMARSFDGSVIPAGKTVVIKEVSGVKMIVALDN